MSKRQSANFPQQKRRRRQWITFVRMCRYGVNNFTRNAWLTVAATAVMTITLLIIFMTVVAQNVLTDSVTEMRRKIDMSIYLDTKIPSKEANLIADDLRKLSNVESVAYVSPSEAREVFVEQNKQNTAALEALKNATNQFPGTLRVTLRNVNDTSELRNFTATNERVKKWIPEDRKPSFDGPRSEAINNLARWTGFVQRIGVGASAIFVIISALIVFNTIRMAIFNRKEEIHMMKLIGADKSFIRGPFVVEAIVYGVIAAVLATGLGLLVLLSTADKLAEYGVAIQPTIQALVTYIVPALLLMIVLGALIGVISSLLATRRYLRI